MTTLVYKRTHSDDPDADGRFGIFDCMGKVRGTEYTAVIGVGGIGPEARRNRIAGKITWIGLGPQKRPGIVLASGKRSRGPLVLFDHFLCYGETGPAFADHAQHLADHVYGKRVRWMNTFTEDEKREIQSILHLAKNAPPSAALLRDIVPGRRSRRC